MKNAKLLLELVTEIIPPGNDQRHSLTIDENGDLVLYFMLGDKFIAIFFTDVDLDKPINQLVNEIELKLIETITIP